MSRSPLSLALGALLCAALAPSAAAQCQVQKFAGTGVAPLDGFGWSLSRSGSTLFVGAIGDDTTAAAGGAVYVFERVGATWTQVQKLTQPGSAVQANFGNSMSVVGDRALVGSHMDGTGRVFHYTRTGGVWNQVQELTAPGLGPMFHFGHHVMISPDGQWAAAGTMRDDHAGVESGAVNLFALSGGSFVWVAKVVASDAAPLARFGRTVAIEGNTLLVGAHRHDAERGAVYAFTRNDNGTPANPLDDTWSQTQKLQASDGVAGDHFGLGLSMQADEVAIGAETDVHNGISSGSVYLFRRLGGVWTQVQKITPPDAAADDGYGASTLLRGDRLLVGAKFRDEGAPDTGAVYVLERISGFFLPATKLVAEDAADSWFQGDEVSLDLDGDVVLSTAWGVSTNSGAAYAFELPRLYCTGKLNTAGCVPVVSYFGGHASTTNTAPWLVTAALVINNKVGLFFYSTNGEASIPFQGGTLCIGSPITRTNGQFSGGLPPPDDCTGKYSLDFNAYIQTGANANLVPGAVVNGQYWYRDPNHPVNGSGLSNAIEFEICD